MKYLAVIAVNFTLSASLFGLMDWFEGQKALMASINKEHAKEMSKLQKIPAINQKMQSLIIPNVGKQPQGFEDGALKIVKFYDAHSDAYNLIVKNYLYSSEGGENIDFSFKLPRDDKESLKRLIKLSYDGGFLRFSELNAKQKDIMGMLQITQPHNGKKDADTSK